MNGVRALVGVGALVLTAIAAGFGSGGGGYEVSWRVVAGGGGSSGAGDLVVDGTIGQHAAGTMTGGGFELVAGFWSAPGTGAPPCPADLDGSGTVDVADLLAVLSAWGLCEGCPEDLDGNDVVDFGDLLVVLGAWGPCV